MNAVEKIKAQINDLQNLLIRIQEECSHPGPARASVNKSNTGNYDRADSYWTEHHCTLCDKQWITEQ